MDLVDEQHVAGFERGQGCRRDPSAFRASGRWSGESSRRDPARSARLGSSCQAPAARRTECARAARRGAAPRRSRSAGCRRRPSGRRTRRTSAAAAIAPIDLVFERLFGCDDARGARPPAGRARRGASRASLIGGLGAGLRRYISASRRLRIARCRGDASSVRGDHRLALGAFVLQLQEHRERLRREIGHRRGRAAGAASRMSRNFVTLPCSFATMSRAFCWPMPGSVRRNAWSPRSIASAMRAIGMRERARGRARADAARR